MLDMHTAEEIACELGLPEMALLSESRVQLVARGVPEDLVVPLRLVWCGSPKPLSRKWAQTVGDFGGVVEVGLVAAHLGKTLAVTRAALNSRQLHASKRGAATTDQFDLAVSVYFSSLDHGVEDVARAHAILRQEVALYTRRVARAAADLGFTSMDDALANGRNAVRMHFHGDLALHHKLFERPWTPSPPAMWKLRQPEWWWSA